MSEYVTLIGLFFIAFLCGFITLLTQSKGKSKVSPWNRVLLWAIYSFIILGIISVCRLFLLRTFQIYAWTDYKVFVWDILSAVCGIILAPVLLQQHTFKSTSRTVEYILFFICAIVISGIVLTWQYWVYRNINSAIYHSLLPERFSIIFVSAFMIYEIIDFSFNRFIFKEKGSESAEERKRKKRVALLVSFSCVFTVWAYPVFETFMTNMDEFSFSTKDVIVYFLCFLLLLFIVIYLVTIKMKGKMWNYGVLSIFAFTITAYIQQMFLNGALFLMDGEGIRIESKQKIVNLLIWLGIFAIILGIRVLFKKEWMTIVQFLSLAIVVMQITGGITILISGLNTENMKNDMIDYFSTDGLYEVASEDNVIVFVLDKYDEAYMEQVLEADPDFLQPLQGFTYFPDTVSQFSRTYPSITYMLTNNTFFELPDNTDYSNWAFENCPFWEQLNEQDYSTYFYEETAKFIGESVRKKASNYIEQGTCTREKISFSGCFRSIHMISSFRTMPYILKDYFCYTAEGLNSLVIEEREWKETPYIVDDAQIKETLDEQGLKIGNDKKAFRFIHMFGAHPPYSLNRDGDRVKESKDLYLEQYMGSLRIVFNYLDKLRDIGKYDDSTIVITADHGKNFENGDILPENVNIILFIKPKGDSLEKLKYSDEYASQNDLIPTIEALTGMNLDSKEGVNLFSDEAKNKDRIRYHYFHVVDKTVQKFTRTYEIKGNSLNFDNWIETDEYHDFK